MISLLIILKNQYSKESKSFFYRSLQF